MLIMEICTKNDKKNIILKQTKCKETLKLHLNISFTLMI